MANQPGYERPTDPLEDTVEREAPPVTLIPGRPTLATHWPTPPGGWLANPATVAPPPTTPLPPKDPLAGNPLPARSRPKHLPVILVIAAGVTVLLCLGGVVVATAVGANAYRQAHAQLWVGMGQPVRDGAFEFTADRMTCGVRSIGTIDDYQKPTGQFCVVTLTVMNVGMAPAIFADSIQKAYGPGGVWFSADSAAGLYANPDPQIFMSDINPGNKVQAIVVYDIPTSGAILRLEVHENPWTRGAIIKIT